MSHKQLEQLEQMVELELSISVTTAAERMAAVQARRRLLGEREAVDGGEEIATGAHTESQPSGRSSCTTFLVAEGSMKMLLLALATRRGLRAEVSHRPGELTVALEGSEGALQEVEVEFDRLVEMLTEELAETAMQFVVKQVDSATDERLSSVVEH